MNNLFIKQDLWLKQPMFLKISSKYTNIMVEIYHQIIQYVKLVKKILILMKDLEH
jgi:hypothetical protein